MELMVSAALLPSLLLCLCCLWFQMRSHRKSTRKIGDAKNVSDGWSSKGRRFSADELPGDTLGSSEVVGCSSPLAGWSSLREKAPPLMAMRGGSGPSSEAAGAAAA